MIRTQPTLLFVVNHAAFFVSHRLPLAEAARTAGYDVCVATGVPREVQDAAAANTIRARGFRFEPLILSRAGLNAFGEIATVRGLIRIYRTLRPDIVHHVTLKPVLYGTYAARKARVASVVNAVSGLGYAFLDRSLIGRARMALLFALLRHVLRRPGMAAIFQNDDDANEFVRRRIVTASQVRMIRGSGVDTAVFSPSLEEESPPIVLFPARMLRDKGLVEFVEAARILKDGGTRARFILAGGTDLNRAAVPERTLREWTAEGFVEWWGHQHDMVSVIRRAALVVLPSYREGLSKALLEAASCGKAIVTTDVPGCRDAIIPGESGLLVPPRNAIDLARAIRTLLNNNAMRRAFGEAARRDAVKRFSVQSVTEQTLAVYSDLLADVGRRTRNAPGST